MRFSPFSTVSLFVVFIASSLASLAVSITNSYAGTYAQISVSYSKATHEMTYTWSTGGSTPTYWGPSVQIMPVTGDHGTQSNTPIVNFSPQHVISQTVTIPYAQGSWLKLTAGVYNGTNMSAADSLALNPPTIEYFQLGVMEQQAAVASYDKTVYVGVTNNIPPISGGSGTGSYYYYMGPSYSTRIPGDYEISTGLLGTVHYKVMRTGDLDYYDSPLSHEYTMTIVKEDQTAPRFNSSSQTVVGGASASLPAPAASTLPHGALIWSITSGPTSSISGANVNYTGTGTMLLQAKYGATSRLNESNSTPFTIIITAAPATRNRASTRTNAIPQQPDEPALVKGVSDRPGEDLYTLKLVNNSTHEMVISASMDRGNILESGNLKESIYRTVPAGESTTIRVYVASGVRGELKTNTTTGDTRRVINKTAGP